MSEKSYIYDVAFSFVAKDEELAVKLNDLIKNRLNTFIYFEKQDVLAGNDGEKKFNQVFSSESRIIVVLYREGWGETSFTRIEETAIRNRAFDEGYDFTIFIPLDAEPSVPEWLPKAQLWVGLERWGIEGAASAIEAKVQEFGGTVHEETATDIAARLAEEMEREDNKKKLLNSEKGVKLAELEVEILFSEIADLTNNISSQSDYTSCKIIQPTHNHLVIHLEKISLVLRWDNWIINSLDEAILFVDLLEGFPRLPNYIVHKDPIVMQNRKFQFDINRFDKNGWIEKKYKAEFFVTNQFAENLMKDLLDRVSKKMQQEINAKRTN